MTGILFNMFTKNIEHIFAISKKLRRFGEGSEGRGDRGILLTLKVLG